ncbi:MAG: beta-galactosidase, partial [Myxococcota bacterium]
MGSARREGTSNTSVPGSAHRDSTSHDRTTHPGVRIQDGELQLGSRSVPLLSGAVHYFRLPPSSWRPCLRSLRELGLPIVETYVPWGVHELEANAIDFSHPERNLGQFLDAVEAEGLLAFLRPGPHVNAEMTCFGLPEHVVFDSACQARSPRQNPVYLGFPPLMFPVPSYASEVFHGEVARWYEAVGAVVAPRIWPDGPVVMLQVDNEAAYYFRNGPYDQDYHADSITLWHKFLKKRYGSLAKLGLAHRRVYPSWAEVDAPSRFEAHRPEQLPQHLDWAAFQEHVLSGSLRRMRDEMAKSGLSGVPIVHNLPLGDGGLPVSIPAMNRVVDLVGLDYYHGARQHRAIKRRTLYLAGTVDFAYAPELGVGAPPWFTPLTHRDSLFCATAAWAYGIRGFNLYMAVDRDRWYGAPIGHEGTPREEYKDWQRCITVLKEHKFHQLQRKVEVALIFPREYARLSRATHLFGPI